MLLRPKLRIAIHVGGWVYVKMITLYDHIKQLYDEQLYSSVITLAPMVITVNENNFIDHVTPQEAFQTYLFYADSLFNMKFYRKAETVYRKILQIRKSVLKPRGALKPHDSNKDIPSEVDIKYKMHLCYLNINQPQEAIDILQSIPAKQRTVKINMGLGQAYDKGGLAKQAISAYKEALKACPMALDVAERLLALKMPLNSVIDLMMNGVSNLMAWDCPGGIKDFIEALGLAKSSQWTDAANALCTIDRPNHLLKGCPNLYVTLGEVHYYAGEYKAAINAFQKAHTIDPIMLRGLDSYAACLARESRLLDRADTLIPSSLPTAEYMPQHWLILAHIHVDRRKLPFATYLAQKACFAEPRNGEALIVKGNILLTMKKFPEALEHFREAMDASPDRYESYAGLAEAHIGIHRSRQAICVAMECCKKFNQSARALTLYANMLLKEGEAGAQSRVRELLKKAISLDNRYFPASIALARLITNEEDSKGDISLLEKQVEAHPSAALHQALGDIWSKRGGPIGSEHAVLHYGAALALDPGNRRASDALARLDRLPTTQQGNQSGSTPANAEQSVEDGDNTYELVTDAHVQSDNSNAPEESETEAVWSDMDLEVP